MNKNCTEENKNGAEVSKPLEFDALLSASSAETSERSSSALISAFVFSCGIEQLANALSSLSMHVLRSERERDDQSDI